MKITFTGVTGLLVETDNTKIMIDPYLTDSLYEKIGDDFKRMVPVRESFLNIHPDIILLSHMHGDHTDIQSLSALLDTDKTIQVLAAANAWKKVRGEITREHNYITAYPNIEWTQKDVKISVIPAIHSDESAVGFIIQAENKAIYFTGDTLYSESITKSINIPIDIAFVVMNGKGNNMNSTDAVRFVKKVGAKLAVPVHWGMFEKFSASPEEFEKIAIKSGVKTKIMQTYDCVEI